MDTSVLNVVIGLILIYLLYSLLATAIQEALASLFQRRANTLHKGIKSMLTNKEPKQAVFIELGITLASLWKKLFYWIASWFIDVQEERRYLHEKFYDHPIIKNYAENIIFNRPSYLTSENFSTILVETLKNLDPNNEFLTANFNMVSDVVNNFSNIPQTQQIINSSGILIDRDTYKILNYHLNEAAGDLDVFKFRIGKWYTDTMDRVAGWYKRSTQFWLLVLGLFLSIVFNIDTVEITNYLSVNKQAAEKLADIGVALAVNSKDSNTNKKLQEIANNLKSNANNVNVVVGLGWGDYGRTSDSFKNEFLRKNIDVETLYNTAVKCALDENSIKIDSLKTFADSFRKQITTILLNKPHKNKSSVKQIDSLKLINTQKKIDSLQHNSLLINQREFSKLYDSDIGADIKEQYIFYRLTSERKKWIGFILTAIAISLGAPFWFDLLNKFVSLRTAVKTVDSSGSTTKNNSSDDNDIDG